MLQSYNAKVLGGKLIVSGGVEIPENTDFVIVLDKIAKVKKSAKAKNTQAINLENEDEQARKVRIKKQGEAILQFMEAVENSDERFTDEDFAELENHRTNIYRGGLDL